MSASLVFDRNILAISTTHGIAATEKIINAQSSPDVSFEISRSGIMVPFLRCGQRTISMHSRFDPRGEAEKIAGNNQHKGFFVFLGMGGAYNIVPFLEGVRLSRGIIIEYDAGIVRAILENIDLTHVLSDKRLTLIIDPDEDELKELFISKYVPSITGDMAVIPLHGRIDAEPQKFQAAAGFIKNFMNYVSDDYSVQAFFGKRWFSNIIKNLPLASASRPSIPPIKNAAVSAAGPSLELQLETLRTRAKDIFLIATDTSLSALNGFGLKPDAVISIDCQHISYYHFMSGIPAGVPVFLDLASPPTVARVSGGAYFFTSGHPLARYIAAKFRAFPVIDTSGGNVTQAAVSLAEFLGAHRIFVYGADFSYPFGKSYARGTYVYPYFYARQSRLKPSESLFGDFLFRNQVLERQNDENGVFRYVTKPLVAYKERLERFAAYSRALVLPQRELGVQVTGSPDDKARRKDTGSMFASGKTFKTTKDFLSDYHRAISRLSIPELSAGRYMDSLTAAERDIWTTMLPSAAAIKRESEDGSIPSHELLETTRLWCQREVEEALDSQLT